MADNSNVDAVRLASRPLRYEISIMRDSRWQIIEVLNDGREKLARPFDRRDLELLEQRVRNVANEYLNKPDIEAVRVVQQRLRSEGDYSETLVLEKQAEKRGETPVGGLGRLTTAPPQCNTVDDLLSRPACRAMGILLGKLFTDINGSPLEFLCDDSWGRRLEKHEGLITSAIRAAAAMQASGPAVRARTEALERLVDAARKRRRAAFRDPELVPSKNTESGFDPGELDRFIGTLPLNQQDRRFLGLRALCRAVPSTAPWDAKVSLALSLPGPNGSAEAWNMVDEFVAGYLINAKYVMEILGERQDLSKALEALVGLCTGSAPDKRCSPVATPLAQAIEGGKLPFCRDELVDRLVTSWGSPRPLTKGRFAEELETLKALQAKMALALPGIARKIIEIGDRRKSELWQRDDVV